MPATFTEALQAKFAGDATLAGLGLAAYRGIAGPDAGEKWITHKKVSSRLLEVYSDEKVNELNICIRVYDNDPDVAETNGEIVAERIQAWGPFAYDRGTSLPLLRVGEGGGGKSSARQSGERGSYYYEIPYLARCRTPNT